MVGARERRVNSLEKLDGNNPHVTTLFAKGWNDRVLKLYGKKFEVNEEFIAGITSLAMDGIQLFRDKKEA